MLRLFAITADNCDNNDIIRIVLQYMLRKRNIEWDAEIYTIKYISHVINFDVEALIKKLDATFKNSEETRYFKERRINKIKNNGLFSVIINKIYISCF